MSNGTWETLEREVSKVFTPSAPINLRDLFAGRVEQLRQVGDAVNQRGQHAIIYGERGVGKTSLVNVIVAIFSNNKCLAVRVNAVSSDNYTKLWRKLFSDIRLTQQVNKIGFQAQSVTKQFSILDEFGVLKDDQIEPDVVRQILTVLSANFDLILIMDEFDRITSENMKTAIADTIKTLSDNAISATIIVVGVADSVDDLIKEHYSIERALVQIQMPRMSPNERYEIIEKGLKHLKMTIEENAKKYISNLSQGLPHYIHSLALHAARVAIDKKTKHIVDAHIEIALEKALEGAQQSTKNLYHKAITSVKKNNIYAQVLLACSLAKTDSLGYFAAVDVREPLSSIMKKAYSIASFSRHLKDFCKEARGPILQQFGTKHRYRFRFANPLMQPYITMKGIKDGKIENLELFPGRMPVS